jgi:uncharacterized flavoprotein (TIGR03862 family)
MTKTAAVIGGGPAGLMAAEMLAKAGVSVTIYDAKPSLGRKFLMAGKSGLNLTKDEGLEAILEAYGAHSEEMRPMVTVFDAQKLQGWVRSLGQSLFIGSTRRVFPEAMKASPLLRAWFERLDELDVTRVTRWKFKGWSGDGLQFDTPDGPQLVQADATVLALGGASWARLGSDGQWVETFESKDIPTVPFGAMNVGIRVDWSPHMAKHFGGAIKGVTWSVNDQVSRGEAVVSMRGIEGGGVYSLSEALGTGAVLTVDLLPDVKLEDVAHRLFKPRGKTSLTNHLRKALRLSPVKIAMLQEFGRPLPENAGKLAQLIKALPVPHTGLNPLDEAISTSGGVPWSELEPSLMLREYPGIFCAGEMLDWAAPTGGYLINGCLATGRWAGISAIRYLGVEEE